MLFIFSESRPATLLTIIACLTLWSCGSSTSSTTDNSNPSTDNIIYPSLLSSCSIERSYIDQVNITDTYYAAQWHLNSANHLHIKAYEAWQNTNHCYGETIKISVVDTGIETGHPDLQSNIDLSSSYDFHTNRTGVTLSPSETHGTSVAGLIAASMNGYGVVGVAPLAKLSYLNLLDDDSFTLSNLARALDATAGADIYNNSWGPSDDTLELHHRSAIFKDSIDSGTENGRNGKGSIYVWAAGNGYPFNSNYDGYANYRKVIAVGALIQSGERASYSEEGANLLIATPGGDCTFLGGIYTDTLPDNSQSEAITSTFCGTSASAPIASGVVALILETRPDLTWRDVQQILAKSATTNAPNDPDWSTNAAGLSINHKYGHGSVDTAAALEMARDWQLLPAERSFSSTSTFSYSLIDDANAGTFSLVIENPGFDKIESVELTLYTDHTFWSDLDITLTSPSQTESILTTSYPCDTCSINNGHDISGFTFSSKRLMDENPSGEWILHVSDAFEDDEGSISRINLTIYGHNEP